MGHHSSSLATIADQSPVLMRPIPHPSQIVQGVYKTVAFAQQNVNLCRPVLTTRCWCKVQGNLNTHRYQSAGSDARFERMLKSWQFTIVYVYLFIIKHTKEGGCSLLDTNFF